MSASDRCIGEGEPCPYCGADADFADGVSTGDRHYECGKCRARGPEVRSRYFGDYDEHLDPTQRAWEAWNRRESPDAKECVNE